MILLVMICVSNNSFLWLFGMFRAALVWRHICRNALHLVFKFWNFMRFIICRNVILNYFFLLKNCFFEDGDKEPVQVCDKNGVVINVFLYFCFIILYNSIMYKMLPRTVTIQLQLVFLRIRYPYLGWIYETWVFLAVSRLKVKMSSLSYVCTIIVFSATTCVVISCLLYIMKHFIDIKLFWWPELVVAWIG